MLYEIKLSVSKEDKIAKEHYILDAVNHGDAEKQGYEIYPTGTEIDVFAVFRSDIKEIVNKKEYDKPFFKATVIDVFTDDSGKEKETKYQMLVCAKNIMEATTMMEQYLQQGYDMRLDAIRKVRIVDYLGES